MAKGQLVDCAERLQQVVDGVHLERPHCVLVVRSDEDHGRHLFRSDRAHDIEASAIWELDTKQHDVDGPALIVATASATESHSPTTSTHCSPMLIGSLPFVLRTASDRPGVVVIAVARACPRMARAVITIAVS